MHVLAMTLPAMPVRTIGFDPCPWLKPEQKCLVPEVVERSKGPTANESLLHGQSRHRVEAEQGAFCQTRGLIEGIHEYRLNRA